MKKSGHILTNLFKSKRKRIISAAAFVMAALFVISSCIAFGPWTIEAKASEVTHITGEELFNGDASRGAFCEIFAVEKHSDGTPYVHRAINRSNDDWHKGTTLNLYELGTSSKWLLRWDADWNEGWIEGKGAFMIYAVVDQGGGSIRLTPVRRHWFWMMIMDRMRFSRVKE